MKNFFGKTITQGVGEPLTREEIWRSKYDMLNPFLRRFSTQSTEALKENLNRAFESQLETLRLETLHLVKSNSSLLSQVAGYYFEQPSKRLRPLVVLLFSQATNGLGKDWQLKLWESTHPGAGGRKDELDIPFSRPDILSHYSPQHKARFRDACSVLGESSRFPQVLPLHNRASPPIFPSSSHTLYTPTTILPTQFCLAKMAEMVHTATLLHDDVLDGSTLRRGAPAAPCIFSRKLCVLGGQYLTTLASLLLVQLRDPEVTRMVSRIITNLIDGEMLQSKDPLDGGDITVKLDGMKRCETHRRAWNFYLQKSYLKTGALMARGLRAVVMLGGCVQGEKWREVAYAYGRNIGLAFQISDDILDANSSTETLGKPGQVDIALGLVTAPVLYAWEEFPEMGELIKRRFQSPGDAEKALDLVHRSSAIKRSTELVQEYADQAKKMLRELPHSHARDRLEKLTDEVVSRDR